MRFPALTKACSLPPEFDPLTFYFLLTRSRHKSTDLFSEETMYFVLSLFSNKVHGRIYFHILIFYLLAESAIKHFESLPGVIPTCWRDAAVRDKEQSLHFSIAARVPSGDLHYRGHWPATSTHETTA